MKFGRTLLLLATKCQLSRAEEISKLRRITKDYEISFNYSDWVSPLYSSYENSLNPAFFKNISGALSFAIGVFALYQAYSLLADEKQRQITRSRLSTNEIIKFILICLQILLYTALCYLNRFTSIATSSLGIDTFVLSLIIGPLQYFTPYKSSVSLSSILLYWSVHVPFTLISLVQDNLSDHKIFADDGVTRILELVVFINTVSIILLEVYKYRPYYDIPAKQTQIETNFFSYLTFSWITPLIKKIYVTDEMRIEDLPPVGESFSSDKSYMCLSNEWNKRYKKSLLGKANFKRRAFRFFGSKESENKPSLFFSIIFAFPYLIFMTCIFELIDVCISFSQPFFLKQLIKHFTDFLNEDFQPPIIKGFALCMGIFLLGIFRALCMSQIVGMSTKLMYSVETSLTTLVYKKALILSPQARKNKPTGEIINHASSDLNMIRYLCQVTQDFIGAPVKLVVCLVALFTLLGKATWGGLLMGAFIIPIAAYANTTIYPVYMKMLEHRDERTSLINEILMSIKNIKFYAWERPMLDKLNSVRNEKELKEFKRLNVRNAILDFSWNCIPFFVSCATYAAYVFINDTPLTPELVFPALVYFDILSQTVLTIPDLSSTMVEAIASLGRIREFLMSEELDLAKTGVFFREMSKGSDDAVTIKNATFLWSEKKKNAYYRDEEENIENDYVALSDINFSAASGKLTCIVGRVGCGKSTLLKAILGQIPIETILCEQEPAANNNTVIKVRGTIAYCPQSPWILNATVKENILFGFKYEKDFYNETIAACELIADFENLPDGDQTVVGEKGISLSGGQKARISLARAVYSRADIFLLDDILSAVDAHVGNNIIKNVLADNGIIGAKAKILSTNSVKVLHQAHKIFLLKNGSITESGEYNQIMSQDLDLAKLIREFGTDKDNKIEVSKDCASIKSGSTKDSLEHFDEHAADDIGKKRSIDNRRASIVSFNHDYAKDDEGETKIKRTGMQDEFMATGGIKWSSILEYLKACNLKIVTVYFLITFGISLLEIGQRYVLSFWAETNSRLGYTENPGFYLSVYTLLGVSGGVLLFVSSFILWTFSVARGSAYLHQKMAKAVLRAPMAYFESTPIGRILNRFTDDFITVDMSLPWLLIMSLTAFFQLLASMFVIMVNLPIMIILTLCLLFVYNYYREQYIPSSRQLKRLSKISKSPLLATIQESLNGVDTIKAFDQQNRFIFKTKLFVDRYVLSQYVGFCCTRWLSIRLQFISASLLFFTSSFAVSTLLAEKSITPGTLGFIMTFAFSITNNLTMLVRMWADAETQSVALERIIEYCDLTPEAPEIVEANRPSKKWPQLGSVRFENYSTRYRENLDPVLRNIDMSIKPGEKIGIVGRTGAGKSSLTLALFRIIEAINGHISIDGVDISKIGLYDLRHNLNIIPQDSNTVKGSIRDNLDPFHQYTDEKLWTVLRLANLENHVRQMITRPSEQQIKNDADLVDLTGLQAIVDEGGSNLSSGQKQLLSLARALLNDHSKILILDEATSSVDVQTDQIIQNTIRSEFKDKTIFTIAHRLDTIMDSDRVLVLDQGKIMEFESPAGLLGRDDSLFRSLCKEGGYL